MYGKDKLEREAKEFAEKIASGNYEFTPFVVHGRAPLNSGTTQDRIDKERIIIPKSRLEYVRNDMTYFTLGPAYFSIGIPFDLVEQFKRTPEGKDVEHGRWYTSIFKLNNIPGWENIVEAIDNSHWPFFYRFIHECVFTKNNNVYMINLQELAMYIKGRLFTLMVGCPYNDLKVIECFAKSDNSIDFYSRERNKHENKI